MQLETLVRVAINETIGAAASVPQSYLHNQPVDRER